MTQFVWGHFLIPLRTAQSLGGAPNTNVTGLFPPNIYAEKGMVFHNGVAPEDPRLGTGEDIGYHLMYEATFSCYCRESCQTQKISLDTSRTIALISHSVKVAM
jgi:hypothetical protein